MNPFKLYGTNSRIIDDLNDIAVLETQYTSIDEVFQAYDQAIISGYEGLVMMHKNSSYKMGRHSLNSGMAYKIKEDNLQFDGVTVLEEGTEVIEGVDKKINELGRSVTSKLKNTVPKWIMQRLQSSYGRW
jgi:collagenase-like PrtC family protease